MVEFNKEVVELTLSKVVKILEENNIEYRFLGSIVTAAINGKLHRNIGDLDLIIDSKGKDILYGELKKLGYKQTEGLFAFSRRYMALETMDSLQLLGVGFFYGNWQKDGSFVLGGKKACAIMDSYALSPTQYSLYGIKFIGLPKRVIATGINASKSNPKRQNEILLLKNEGIIPLPNTYIHIKVFSWAVDWIYHLTMATLNLIGGIRMKMGLAFDPWR